MENDFMILNYNDVCIYQSDLDILRCKTAWINDTIIRYQLTRLENLHPKTSTDKEEPFSIGFIDPSITSFFIHQLSLKDLDDRVELEHLGHQWIDGVSEHKAKIILIPINSNFSKSAADAFTSGYGLHWSLMVMIVSIVNVKSAPNTIFYHWDSSVGFNQEAATIVASRMNIMIHLASNYNKNDQTDKYIQMNMVQVRECKTIQQSNGYDCGLHVLMNAEAIIKFIHHFRWKDVDETNVMDKIQHYFENDLFDWVRAQETAQQISISKLRLGILEDILELANHV